MSIPLDRLYHFLENLSGDDIIIYRFYPHGAKNLKNLENLNATDSHRNWLQLMTTPCAIFHDQEPLDYNLYNEDICKNVWTENRPPAQAQSQATQNLVSKMNLRSNLLIPWHGHDRVILCHSEKNSDQLSRYEENGFIGVYWWSHAAISRDWYRYAQHDQRLQPNFDLIKKDFLIYNRAWSSTREYRLKIAEMLINQNVNHYCNTKFNAQCSGSHYTQHHFKNPELAVNRQDIEKHYELNNYHASASADYDNHDYAESAVELVLETLFDDSRIHLTEKTLRPIACGRPFILAATPGSLQYLRNYGFQTFSNFIDESYDSIVNPLQRLNSIVTEMKRITSLSEHSKKNLWTELYKISKQNQQLFFSDSWHDSIVQEYSNNFAQARNSLNQYRTGYYYKKLRENIQPDDTLYSRMNTHTSDRGPKEIQEFFNWTQSTDRL